MPCNKFYPCFRNLFFEGLLLFTLTVIVVFMVFQPCRNNKNIMGTTEDMVVIKIKDKQGTSVAPTPDQGKPFLFSSPTPFPLNTSFPTTGTKPTSPISTGISPITTITSPITTRSSPITASPTTTRTSCPENDTEMVYAGHGQISSPRFPSNYPPNMCHTWKFWTGPWQNVSIKFLYFHVESYYGCPYDSVTIVIDGALPGQKYCGGGDNVNNIPAGLTKIIGSRVEVTMVSDSSHQEKGFKLGYGNIPKNFTSPITTHTSPITTRTSPITTHTLPATTRTSCPENDTEMVYAGQGEISSPRFPSNYPPNMCHTWKFWTGPWTNVSIKFLYFDVENFYGCPYDSVTIVIDGALPGQKYCGGGYNNIPAGLTKIIGSRVEVTMVSDSSQEELGFKLGYGNIPKFG